MGDVQLFDGRGKFIGTDEIYESLTDDQKPKFLAVAEAVQAAEASQQEVRDADTALTEAIRKHGIAQALAEKLGPKLTQTDNARAFIERAHKDAQR